MLRRIIICILLGAITVLGINLQYFLRHPEEKLFGSTGEIIFSFFACPAFALVFLLVWLAFFQVKKEINNAKEDKKDTDDDGRCINVNHHCEKCKDHGNGDNDIYCHSKVHCSSCPPAWRCRHCSVKQ